MIGGGGVNKRRQHSIARSFARLATLESYAQSHLLANVRVLMNATRDNKPNWH